MSMLDQSGKDARMYILCTVHMYILCNISVTIMHTCLGHRPHSSISLSKQTLHRLRTHVCLLDPCGAPAAKIHLQPLSAFAIGGASPLLFLFPPRSGVWPASSGSLIVACSVVGVASLVNSNCFVALFRARDRDPSVLSVLVVQTSMYDVCTFSLTAVRRGLQENRGTRNGMPPVAAHTPIRVALLPSGNAPFRG